MKFKAKVVLFLALVCVVFVLLPVAALHAQELDPLQDYRYAGVVVRGEDGKTLRSSKVITAFKRLWACPATSAHIGACPGWAIDHVIPLACGGRDAVFNMQWLPDQIKSERGEWSKDHFERRIYGGHELSTGCP